MKQVLGHLQTFQELILDAFAPARCIDCCIDGTWYCASCRHNLPPAHHVCIGCKTDHPRGITCIACREDIRLTGAVSAGQYSNRALQRGIEWLKFRGVRDVADTLGALIIPNLLRIASLQDLSEGATLVPIPLHVRKQRQRGFNQSEDIARAISTICNIPVSPLLRRVKSTASQAKLPHEMRKENIRDAFALAYTQEEYATLVTTRPVIILIDDVSTTGSTLIEATEAFPKNPDVTIWGATVARG